MTDQRPPREWAPDTEEVVRRPDRDRSADAPQAPSHGDKPQEPNPLLREGPDAPDAADIEDPDEQL